MRNIKWVGIIEDELAQYQRGKLPDVAEKVAIPESMKGMMINAIPCLIISIIVLFSSMFVKTFLCKQVVIHPIWIAIGFFIGFLSLLLHELLHAIVYPKEAKVYIGIYPKAFVAVALSSYPLSRKRFALMSLLPYILGIIPIVGFLISPAHYVRLNGFLYGMAIMGLVSPYTDLYNVIQMLKHAPIGSKIQFYENGMYYFK